MTAALSQTQLNSLNSSQLTSKVQDKLLKKSYEKKQWEEKWNILTKSCWILIRTCCALLLALSIRSSNNDDGFLECSSLKACQTASQVCQSWNVLKMMTWMCSSIYSLGCIISKGDSVPAVLLPPAPAFSWVSEWHVSEILGPVKLHVQLTSNQMKSRPHSVDAEGSTTDCIETREHAAIYMPVLNQDFVLLLCLFITLDNKRNRHLFWERGKGIHTRRYMTKKNRKTRNKTNRNSRRATQY